MVYTLVRDPIAKPVLYTKTTYPSLALPLTSLTQFKLLLPVTIITLFISSSAYSAMHWHVMKTKMTVYQNKLS